MARRQARPDGENVVRSTIRVEEAGRLDTKSLILKRMYICEESLY